MFAEILVRLEQAMSGEVRLIKGKPVSGRPVMSTVTTTTTAVVTTNVVVVVVASAPQ